MDNSESASATTGRNENQMCLQSEFKERLQEKQKKVQELKQAVNTIKLSAQTAVEDSERIFTEMISSMEKKRSEVTELIRAQEKAELSRAERLLEQLEQEIADLQRRVTELEQLSHTHDHIHFLQSFQFPCVSSGHDDTSSITVHQHLSFDGVRNSLSELKKRLEEFCEEEFNKIPPHGDVQMTCREDFLKHFCYLTLDPNTAYRKLILSENSRVVTLSRSEQQYSDHPERFDSCFQVLCKERVCGRCYWEVEWRGVASVSVSYENGFERKEADGSLFGSSSQSWSLRFSSEVISFWHNDVMIQLEGPTPSRIGVYVDHSAGTLSFYSVSDTMKLLHRVHTTFTQPLCVGCGVHWYDGYSFLRFCDAK